jgi:hypothetical protein
MKEALQEIGKRGGLERAKRLSGKRRKEIATKASKAAAKARTRKARERKEATP